MNLNYIFGAKMTNLSIKDVPEQWAENLRLRATRNHRSLQGELMAILEAAIRTPAQQPSHENPLASAFASNPPTGLIRRADGSTLQSTRRGWKTVEEVMAAMRAQHPELLNPANVTDMQPSSLDLIKEAREERDQQLSRRL